MENEEYSGKNVFIIQMAKAGGEFKDVTFDYECFDCYADKKAALEALVDWMTKRFFDWITKDDENGISKVKENILKGISFEDGNGNRWQVESKLFDDIAGVNEFDTEESANDKLRSVWVCKDKSTDS